MCYVGNYSISIWIQRIDTSLQGSIGLHTEQDKSSSLSATVLSYAPFQYYHAVHGQMFKAPTKYVFFTHGPPQKVLLSLGYYKALKTQYSATGCCGKGSQFGTTQNRRPASLSHSDRSPAPCERYTELLALLLRIRESPLQMSDRRQATVIEILRGFSESLQVRLRHNTLRPIPSAFLPISSNRKLRNMNMHTNFT